MTIRPIVQYPDAALRTPCAPVGSFDADLRQLADDLLDAMRAAPGVGITAPHIGILQRITVIELSPGDVRIFVNPVVEVASATLQRFTEGSVSMLGVNEEVERPDRIRVRFQTLSGDAAQEEATGFPATCLQHEIDQLDGIFWLQRLSRLKRERAVKKWQKLRQG